MSKTGHETAAFRERAGSGAARWPSLGREGTALPPGEDEGCPWGSAGCASAAGWPAVSGAVRMREPFGVGRSLARGWTQQEGAGRRGSARARGGCGTLASSSWQRVRGAWPGQAGAERAGGSCLGIHHKPSFQTRLCK